MSSQKFTKNQQGMAHIMMIGLVVVVIAAVVAVGLSVSKKNKPATVNSTTASSSTKSPATAAAADATCLATYKDANLCHFSSNSTSFDKASYKATLTVTGSPNGDASMVLLNDGKGNTSLVTSGGGASFSSITLAGNTYMQTTDGGTWTEYPSGNTAAPTTDPTSDMNIGVGANGIYFKYVSTEACGSLTCFKYQVTDNAMAGTTQYVWFDKSKYQLQEWQATDPTNGTTDMKITYQSVNITKPSPVQVFSASSGYGQ